MNLRLLLVLITVLSFVAIGATWFITNPTEEPKEKSPPFFYTLSPEDIRNIEIETGGEKRSWSRKEGTRRWYFDDLNEVPVSLYRWGGVTQLLGGPRTQRVLSKEIDDNSLYGLDNPSTTIAITLRNGSRTFLSLGNITPDQTNHYARMTTVSAQQKVVEYPQLVLVDATWGSVLGRLVTEPPLPDWYYTLNGNVREVLLFDDNEVIRAYGIDRSTEIWHVCDLPVDGDPCIGSVLADNDALKAELEHFGNPKIAGAVELNLRNDDDYVQYGTTQESPYIAVRIENKKETGVTEVTRLSMTIGDVTPDGRSRYAVANETSDVIAIDLEWADRVLELFFGDVLSAKN